MSVIFIIDEEKGNARTCLETHSYRENGIELSEEWNTKINDFVFSNQEQFPELFNSIDKMIDEEIREEVQKIREEDVVIK